MDLLCNWSNHIIGYSGFLARGEDKKMTNKKSNWKLDVCPNCHSQNFNWTPDADGSYIECNNCKRAFSKPKTITVVEK